MKALIPLHNAWRSLLKLQRKMKRKMGLNKRKLLCGTMNDLEHFSLLEYQKSYWDKKQDISNMQINEFQSHLFPLRFVMPRNFISISYKSFSNKNKTPPSAASSSSSAVHPNCLCRLTGDRIVQNFA